MYSFIKWLNSVLLEVYVKFLIRYSKRYVLWAEDSTWLTKWVNGTTYAHRLARHGFIFDNYDILVTRDERGWTVAHEMAASGHVFDELNELIRTATISINHITPEDILLLRTNDGTTVAHFMHINGYNFNSKRIYKALGLLPV